MKNNPYAFINNQKRNYRDRYIFYYNQYKGDIPYDIMLQLKAYRQSLGLSSTDVDDVIDKLKNPELIVRRIISKQDTEPVVDISAVKEEASMLGEDYANLIDKLSEFEYIAKEVLEMTSQLSGRCKAVAKNLSDVGTTMAKIGFQRMKKQKSGGSATFGIGLAIAAAAEIYDQYQKYRIQQKEERRLQTLLEKKQAYANMSYESIHKALEQFQANLPKFDNMLSKSGDLIAWKDSSRDKKLKMFEIAFFCKIKRQYDIEVLNFVLQEMEAWMNGYQNSDAPYPSLKNLIDDEIHFWAALILKTENFDENKWIKYLENLITKNKDFYWPIEYMLLTKSYFLRNYVGVTLWETDPERLCSLHRETPIITALAEEARDKIDMLTHEKQQICSNVKEMLSTNAYFNECRQLISSNIKLTKFGFWDVCALAIMFFVFWIGTFVLMVIFMGMIEGGDIGFIVSILSILGLTYLLHRKREFFLRLMPCIRKNKKYFTKLDRNLRDKEKTIVNKYNNIKL